MYRITAFAIGIFVVLGDTDIKEKCFNRLNKKVCCTGIFESEDVVTRIDNVLQECIQATPDNECEIAKCLARKDGMTEDVMDIHKFRNYIQTKFVKFEIIKDSIIKNCIDEEFNIEGDDCPLLTTYRCVHFNILQNCPGWRDDAECQAIKSTTEECETLLHGRNK